MDCTKFKEDIRRIWYTCRWVRARRQGNLNLAVCKQQGINCTNKSKLYRMGSREKGRGAGMEPPMAATPPPGQRHHKPLLHQNLLHPETPQSLLVHLRASAAPCSAPPPRPSQRRSRAPYPLLRLQNHLSPTLLPGRPPQMLGCIIEDQEEKEGTLDLCWLCSSQPHAPSPI
jgi:hypothetical protein